MTDSWQSFNALHQTLWPLTYLLNKLHAGKNDDKDVTISALQAAICLSENAFTTLSVECRRYVLQQHNHHLVPLTEQEYELSGKLFGDDFGERAKAWVHVIHSLSWSSLVFFWLGDFLCATNSDRALGVAKKFQRTGLHIVAKTEDDGKNRALRARQTRSDQWTTRTKANIKLVKSKRVNQTKVDLQPDIAMQPPSLHPCFSPDEHPL